MIQITDMRVHPGDSAFLVDDGKTAILYDSGLGFTGERLAQKLRRHLGGRELDYIFLTHSHYDHAYGAVYVKREFPAVCICAGEYAAKIFQKPGAKATMRDLDTKMARSCGVDSYIDLLDSLAVDIPLQDGQILSAGDMSFVCLNLPGHTKCSFGFFEQNSGLLLACESMGSYNGEDDVVPECLVSSRMSFESIERVRQLAPSRILSPHYGELKGEQVEWFLRRAEESLRETVDMICSSLRAGESKAAIAERYKDRYYHGYVCEVYPIDAMNLNTGIMIDLIEREYMTE